MGRANLWSTGSWDLLAPESSTPFKIHRGVRQGCPLPPSIFNLFIEVLAEAVCQNPEIKGISFQGKSYKILLYAGDIVFSLSDPLSSIETLIKSSECFGSISGYKVNTTKSATMPLNITIQEQKILQQKVHNLWKSQVKYLGIMLTSSLVMTDLIVLNVSPVIKQTQRNLVDWDS